MCDDFNVIGSDFSAGSGDSDLFTNSNRPEALLEVYQTGPVTVVGFGGKDVPSDLCLSEYRDEITSLIAQHGCTDFAFDLSGVKMIPSGLLGLIASIRDLGVNVSVFNASADVRDVLEITKLNTLIQVRDV
jgi:anti-anti-sigma factor